MIQRSCDGHLYERDAPDAGRDVCIIGAPGGLAPARFVGVFAAATGDKGGTWLGSMGPSAVICVFGVRLFHVVLRIPTPVLKFSVRSRT